MVQHFGDVPEDAHNTIPKGWLLFFVGVIAWGAWYILSYTPQFSGWSQSSVYEQKMAAQEGTEKPVLYENPYENDPKAVDEGRNLYAANCSACHGDDLKGGVGPDLTDHLMYGETDKDKYISIFEGRPNGMPGFGDQLGRDRVWRLLSYIDSVREYGKAP